MDSPDTNRAQRLKVIPKEPLRSKTRFKPSQPKVKTTTGTVKKPDFVCKPIPDDFTKGKLDMQGSFRFNKASDCFEWAYEVWSNPDNLMHAYIYRQVPVCNFEQSSNEPNPELGHNLSKWESWPFGSKDFHVGILERFGSGTYLILFQDTVTGRKIAKIEEWELNNWESYPPKVRVDDIVTDSPKNKSIIAWARNAGCLFPNDKGYVEGKFVHIETQRHKNNNEDDDYMTKGPIGDAIANVTSRVINEAVDNMTRPAPVAPNPVSTSLDHLAAVAAIDLIKDTHQEMTNQKTNEQSALLGIVGDLIKDKNKPDNSGSEGMKLAITTIREMSEMQVRMYKDQMEALERRLERMESRQHAIVAAPSSQGIEEQVLTYLDRQEAIMQRLGYSRRGGRGAEAPEAPPEKDLVSKIMEALPELGKFALQAYTGHMQMQLRLTELHTMQKLGVPITSIPLDQTAPQPQPQPTTTAPPPSNSQQPKAEGPRINEEMRREIGPDFDMYVGSFHEELAKMESVICGKFIEGMQAVVKEEAQTLEEQTDIIADHGALLALWYKEIPGNAHEIMKAYKVVLLNVLKTYKPIWDIMSKAPLEAQQAFIEGFCDPSRLDDDEEEDEIDQPTAKVN